MLSAYLNDNLLINNYTEVIDGAISRINLVEMPSGMYGLTGPNKIIFINSFYLKQTFRNLE